jgi:peptidoglycan/xylan/chitin deacetylase (PgdA/CDA1 family)
MIISNRSVLKLLLTLTGNLNHAKTPSIRKFGGVEIAPFKNNCQAAVTISADFELAWAFRGRSEQLCTLNGIRTRKNHPYLIDLFNKYSIPITWATVGHLFLSSCKRDIHGRAHPEMPRPILNTRFIGDWYKHDPCTDIHQDPLWYSPDLIQDIIKSHIRHEIGTHSFSHIDFSDECSDTELVDKEITSCISAMAPLKLVPRSLVFPYNHMGYSHLTTLFKNNIIAVRHRDNLIRLSYPQRTAEGVYKLFESMNTRRSTIYNYVEKAKILIAEAKKQSSAYHLWFHPSDPSEVFSNEFRKIIEYIALEQENGSVWVVTMTELASYCEARESTTMQLNKTENVFTITLSSSLDKDKFPCTGLTLILHDNFTFENVQCHTTNKIIDIPLQHTVTGGNKRTAMITIPIDTKFIVFNKHGRV